MKSFMLLGLFSLALLVFMVYQAAVQELSIRSSTARIKLLRQQEQAKENEIVSVKVKMQAVQTEINDLKKSEGDLKTQMEQAEKDKASALTSIETCKAWKKETDDKKAWITDTLAKLKEAQEAEKVKAQEDIQKLKQQLLDRDRAICAFVDKNKPEGMKLCGL